MSEFQRILVLVGDPNEVTTRGGQPFFLLKAGKEMNFLHSGLALKPEKLRAYRYTWNLFSLITKGEKGGFQYSKAFLNKLIKQVNLGEEAVEFISYFPLLPPGEWKNNWRVNYYIDATLKQNFEEYGLSNNVGEKVKEDALRQELENYKFAERIICQSRWAAASVVNKYGIHSNKVHFVLPGSSVDEKLIDKIKPNNYPPLQPLRLGFIGKDWQRKRLPFLLQVAESLKSKKTAVEVVVIGSDCDSLPKSSLINCVGFIDKHKQMYNFMKLVQSFHFGCLFSSTEGAPQSILECLRLGVPVLGTNVGGIPDSIPEGLGFVFELDHSPEAIADLLESFVNNPNEYYQLRARVAARAEEFTWQRTVEKFIKVWQGSEEFLYDATKR
jgi:glycosyltransferase involved in cell wall biosynthesis